MAPRSLPVLVLAAVLASALLASPALALDDPVADADPKTTGANATHLVGVRAGTTTGPLTGMTVSYPENVSLAALDGDAITAFVDRDAAAVSSSVAESDVALVPTTVTVADGRVRLRFDGDVRLNATDAVYVRLRVVRNPPADTDPGVGVTVRAGGTSATATARLEVVPPFPTLSATTENGSLVVAYGRGRAWRPPAGAGVVLVARRNGTRLATAYVELPATGTRRTTLLRNATGPVTVAAYRDVDGDRAFDPGRDERYVANAGRPVRERVWLGGPAWRSVHPSLAVQSVGGPRLAARYPAGMDGTLVVRNRTGAVVETRAITTDSQVHVDAPVRELVGTAVDAPLTIELRADPDDDGFDADDPRYRTRDGDPVRVVVSSVTATTTTTTEERTTASPTTSPTPPATTAGPPEPVGTLAVLLAAGALAMGLLARRG